MQYSSSLLQSDLLVYLTQTAISSRKNVRLLGDQEKTPFCFKDMPICFQIVFSFGHRLHSFEAFHRGLQQRIQQVRCTMLPICMYGALAFSCDFLAIQMTPHSVPCTWVKDISLLGEKPRPCSKGTPIAGSGGKDVDTKEPAASHTALGSLVATSGWRQECYKFLFSEGECHQAFNQNNSWSPNHVHQILSSMQPRHCT